jgi:hypothetical protein
MPPTIGPAGLDATTYDTVVSAHANNRLVPPRLLRQSPGTPIVYVPMISCYQLSCKQSCTTCERSMSCWEPEASFLLPSRKCRSLEFDEVYSRFSTGSQCLHESSELVPTLPDIANLLLAKENRSMSSHIAFLGICQTWGQEKLITFNHTSLPKPITLLAHRQLSLWQLPTLRTQPLSRRLVLESHTGPMEPLILAVVVVAAHHVSKRNFLTEAI